MSEELKNTFKDYLIRLATKEFMEWLVKEASFFAWGPVNALAKFFVGKVVTIIIDKTETGIRLLQIEYDIHNKVEKVEEVLEAIRDAKEKGEKDRLDELDDRLTASGRDLIRFGSLK